MVRLILRLLSISSALVLTVSFALGMEPPYGTSKDLPVQFAVKGGEGWCQSVVQVEIDAATPVVLTAATEEFQHMLGRIRAAIEDSCRDVQGIQYFGTVEGKVISIGESLKIINWLYVPYKLYGQDAPCIGPNNGDLCAQRWRVFYDIRQLFLSGVFSTVQLTRYLSTEPGADAEFVEGNVEGRIVFVPISSGVPFDTADEFVHQQAEQQIKLCTGKTSNTKLEAFNSNTAYQGVSCSLPKKISHFHFVISKMPDGFTVIAFSDFSTKGKTGKILAERLKKAISARKSEDAMAGQMFTLRSP